MSEPHYDRQNHQVVQLQEIGCTGIYTDSMGDVYEIDRLTGDCQRK